MSDSYGVGNALKAFHHSMVSASRRTGRTTRMLEQVKSGDQIVITQSSRRRELEPLLKEMGKDVRIVVCPPSDPHQMFIRKGQPEGYTHFDHEWVDEFYRIQLDRITEEFMRLPRDCSGAGVAAAQTRIDAHYRRLGRYPHLDELGQIPETYAPPTWNPKGR